MPDYMEALISQKGLPQVLRDLRNAVIELAERCEDGTDTGSLWMLEGDLLTAVYEVEEDGWK
jgi:hypothetical protein